MLDIRIFYVMSSLQILILICAGDNGSEINMNFHNILLVIVVDLT